MGNKQPTASGETGLVRRASVKSDIDPENPPDPIRGLARLIAAESNRRKDVQRDQYDYTKENMQLLKQLFKKMDPSVMNVGASSTMGEVQLSFKYNAEQQILLVKVIRCCDLSAKDLRGKSSDPYVKLKLLPHVGDNEAILKTAVVKKSLKPEYNEIFTYQCDGMLLIDGVLVVQVWDWDILEADDFIGEAIIRLNTFQFHANPVHTAWYALGVQTDLDIQGDLEVSLNYDPPCTLEVTLHCANNLVNRHGDEDAPNPFVKLQAPGLKDIYFSEVKMSTVNPVWEEKFEFKIAPEEFEQRYLIFHVVDQDDEMVDNDSLGQCIIDLDYFNPDEGYRGKFDLADLQNSERLRSKWFQQATVQEFREALMAHSNFRQPKFLFQKHEGSKVIRVTSRKAGARAKIHIMNGIPVR